MSSLTSNYNSMAAHAMEYRPGETPTRGTPRTMDAAPAADFAVTSEPVLAGPGGMG
jgi:hypothetical protein